MDIAFINDFDFTITDVLLAHRFFYTRDMLFNGYTKGRKVSGIVYCISGQARYQFSDTEVILRPGEIIFLPENTAYSVGCLGEDTFSHITVNFNFAEGDLNKLFPDDYNQFAGQMIITEALDIKELLERLLDLWLHKKYGYRVMAKSVVTEIMYKYLVLLGKKYHTENYDKLKPAKRLLDEDYTLNIPIAKLACACGFSETHFRRLFADTFQCSPTEYRLNKRMLRAKDLLLAGELPISAIASAVGFDDANYFSRVFKAHTGVTPTEYTKEVTPV